MKPYRALPLINFAMRRLRLRTNVDVSRVEAEVICPQEVEAFGPLIHVGGQIEKATSAPKGSDSLEADRQLFRAREVLHVPTIRYTLKDCIVHDAGFDALGKSFGKKPMARPDYLYAPVTEVESLSYCMTPASHTFFGHWLQDAFPTALLAAPQVTIVSDLRQGIPQSDRSAWAAGAQLAPNTARLPRSHSSVAQLMAIEVELVRLPQIGGVGMIERLGTSRTSVPIERDPFRH